MESERTGSCPISEREELLVLKFLDGECSWLERRKASKLLRRSAQAQQFLESMRAIVDDTRLKVSTDEVGRVHGTIDLWERIADRIEQEEHAEFFLGARRSSGVQDRANQSSWQWIFSSFLGGSVVAAAVMLVIFAPAAFQPESGTNVQQPAASSNRIVPAIQTVSSGYDGYSAGRQSLSPSVEVDWMRSDGKIRVYDQPESDNPVIWIERQPSVNSRISRIRRTLDRRLRVQDALSSSGELSTAAMIEHE